MFDYHVHTSYSADSRADVHDVIKAAIEKGIKEIAITDHVDIDYPDKEINFSINLQHYQNTLNAIYEEYSKQIRIVKGIEVGLQEHVLEETHALIDDFHYDYIIGSIHVADKQDLHNGDFFRDKSPAEAYERFYINTYNCLKSYKAYSILGHINLIDRYQKYITKPVHFSKYSDILYEILKMVIEDGKGIEINTSGFRYGMDSFLPSKDILRLYKELSGEIITVGSDAHTTDYLGYKIADVYTLLREEFGFKYITTFKNRKPTQIKL
jgi:histidinol-phosphatase (PHP family)